MENKLVRSEERVIVCLSLHPRALLLLHRGRTLAAHLKADWFAVYIDVPGIRLTEKQNDHIRHLLETAQTLGAQTRRISAETPERGLAALLAEKKFSHFLVEKMSDAAPARAQERLLWQQALDALPRQKKNTSYEIGEISLSPHYANGIVKAPLLAAKPSAIVTALVAGLLLLGVAQVFMRYGSMSFSDFLPVLTACVIITGGLAGFLPALGILLVFYFIGFLAPGDEANALQKPLQMTEGVLFLAGAGIAAFFAALWRNRHVMTLKHLNRRKGLYELQRIASSAHSREQAVESMASVMRGLLEADIAFFFPATLDPDRIELFWPQDTALEEVDKDALHHCWRDMQPAGLRALFKPELAWRFLPLIAPRGEVGVLGVRLLDARKATFDRLCLMDEIADLAAEIVEHIELTRSIEAGRIRDEREKLRSMLLSSVSHDLRTPLASVIGALSLHRSQAVRLSEEKKNILLDTALQEAERLDSFITNILDMTNLESGRIKFKPEWHPAENAVGQMQRRMEHRLRGHQLIISPPDRRIEVHMDLTIAAQALQNIVDNASKYAPASGGIEITWGVASDQRFFYRIRDHGPGIPEEQFERIFDKYARIHKQDSKIAGTGLGLAICRAMIEGQGGEVSVTNHQEGGALFVITLPQWRMAENDGKGP